MSDERCERALDAAAELLEDGRFEDCLRALDRLLRRPGRDGLDDLELAGAHFDRGCCLERLGRAAEAEAAFALAADLAPADFPRPLLLSHDEFESIVRAAIDEIPPGLAAAADDVHVVVRDYPGEEAHDPFLFGLYVGVPRTERDEGPPSIADTVFIYKRPHELECLTLDELRDEVRKTVIHEFGHHFGLEEDDMGEYA